MKTSNKSQDQLLSKGQLKDLPKGQPKDRSNGQVSDQPQRFFHPFQLCWSRIQLFWSNWQSKSLKQALLFVFNTIFSVVIFLLNCLLLLSEITVIVLNKIAKKLTQPVFYLIRSFFYKLDQILQTLRKKIVLLVRQVQKKISSMVFLAQEGQLSIYFLFKLGIKNLIYSHSRTLVTTGAIALGSGAIIFLVSFAYGLQDIVTSRLIFPGATKTADVQSASTALVLNRDSAEEIAQISGVESVSPAISAAGTLEYNNSKTDVVAISTQNDFLEYSNYLPVTGTLFSPEANERYSNYQEKIEELKEIMAQAGNVLGETQAGQLFEIGDFIDNTTIRFRVKDDVYLPLRTEPKTNAEVIGYVRGSLLNTYSAQEVWGSTYQSVDTKGKAFLDTAGNWFGRWLKTAVPLYLEQAPTVYTPLVNENGEQLAHNGYLPQLDTHILSPEEIIVEDKLQQVLFEKAQDQADAQDKKSDKELNELDNLDREGQVLGEATASTGLENSMLGKDEQALEATIGAVTSSVRTAVEDEEETDVAELSAILEAQEREAEQTQELKTSLAVIDVAREGEKEIIVSTGLISIWETPPEEILGKTINLEYVLSGGVISGLSGKVKSNSVLYKVVGVIQDNRSIVITPLGDLESMGADRFTTLKILGKSEEMLSQVRTHIEALGFTTQSLADTLLQVNKLFTVMRFLLGLFGMIALLVAIFGMFNTLTISLLERTREIGVMKTFGTTDTDVLRLFMIESLLIGCLGGLLGVTLGTGLGYLVNLLFNLFRDAPSVNLFVAPLGFIISIFVLSMVVGLATGLYPSNRAKRTHALDALRYE